MLPSTPPDALTAGWLTRFLRHWDVVEGVSIETPREDAATVRDHGEVRSALNSRFLALALGVSNLLFWPSDLYNLRDQPDAIQTLGATRVATSLLCIALFLALTYVRPMRRHPKGVLSVVGAAGCFAMAYFFGRLSGPSGPWFHFIYLLMMMPLVCWLTVPERVAGTIMFGLAAATGYFVMFPTYLRDPLAAVSLSHLAFAVTLSIGAGWVLDYLRRDAFLMRLALARQAAEERGRNEQLDSQVRERTRELQFLASCLESAREAERAAVAREIHDELGQELTALRYALQAATAHFEANPAGIRGNLAQLESLLARTTVTTRNILVELRPRVLDELGLPAAVEWLAERVSELQGLQCTLDLPETPLDLGEEVAVAAFRIIQESLTNVARHAQATVVAVAVKPAGGRLEIMITDDGRGFDPALTGQAPRGMGLLGMRERVRALDGELQVSSRTQGGTTIRVMLPLVPTSAAGAA